MRDDDGHALTSEPTDAELRALREAAGPVAFTPGFTDRVMARQAALRKVPGSASGTRAPQGHSTVCGAEGI